MKELLLFLADAEKFPDPESWPMWNNLPTFAIFMMGKFKNQVQDNKYDVLTRIE